MIQLYDYQNEYVQALRDSIKKGNKRLVLCAPTGGGKTVLFSYMVSEHLKRGGNAIVFSHRSELLTQAGGTFEKFGLVAEYIDANSKPNMHAKLHVAMVETFSRRMNDYELFLAQKTLVIFDEAHLQNFTKIMDFIPKSTIVIGATATPHRKPKEVQMSKFYQDLIHLADTQDLIDKGKLNPAKSYGVLIDLKGIKSKGTDYETAEYYRKNEIYKGVVKNYLRLAKDTKTILFASNVESSKEVFMEFLLNDIPAKHIDGTMSKTDRKLIFDWFDKTPNAVLCNCGIATAGFDQHDIQTVILYRATVSLPLFLQMCGRGSRLSPQTKKDHFKILDFGNNIQRLGFWEGRREWQLEYKTKSKKEQAQPIKECPECSAILVASIRECTYCGYQFPKSKKEEAEEVQLQNLNRIQKGSKKVSELDLEDLIILQKCKKLSSRFVWRVVRSRGESELINYASLIGYSRGWVFNQMENNDVEFKDFTVK